MVDLDKEQLREALASAKQIEAALAERIREQDLILNGLEALQGEEEPAALLQRAFDTLGRSIAFNLALILEPEGESFVCTAAISCRRCASCATPIFSRSASVIYCMRSRSTPSRMRRSTRSM